MQPRAGGVWLPCLWPLHPSRQLSRPGPGAPAAAGCGARAWSLPWGRPGLSRPEAEERDCSPLLCIMLFPCILGFLITVARKPFPHFGPFGGVSLGRCPQVVPLLRRSFTGPLCTQHLLGGAAVHPPHLKAGRHATQGAFYIRLYYFYYHKTFPPDSSINTAFQKKKKRGGDKV